MNKKQEKEMAKMLFWQQFPEDTDELASTIVEYIAQAMDEIGKEIITMGELHGAIGIAVGYLLQMTCQLNNYVGEQDIKDILYDAINKSYDFFKKNPLNPDIILNLDNMSDSEIREYSLHLKSLLSDEE